MYVSPYCYCVDYILLKYLEGGEKTNAKNMIIVLSLLFIGISIHASFVEPVSAASVDVNSSMNNSQIQAVLDNASSGDTINFLGQLYENIQLTINKTLNIVTRVGTVLSGSSSPGSTVFLINGPQASGTKISGFNITGSSSGIIVNNTSNVNISNCNISATSGSAVTINKSSGTNIKNSNIINSVTGINVSNSKSTKITESIVKNNKKDGIDVENSVNTTINHDQITNNAKRGVKVYKSNDTVINGSTLKNNGNRSGISSDEGAVYVKSSNNVKISNNQITENSQGVTTADSSDVTINNNTISYNYGEGILLNGTLKDVSIKGNYISGNCNGIVVNYNTGTNIHISGNVITKSADRTLSEDEDTGIGISFGSGYASNTGTEVIEHNSILDNGVMDMRAKYAQVHPYVGSNWYGYRPLLCSCVNYAAAIKLIGSAIGANTYVGGFYDGATGALVTDLYPTQVTLTGNGFSQTLTAYGGQAIFQVDPNLSAGTLILSANRVKAYINRIIEDSGNNHQEGDSNSTVDPSGSGGGGNGPGSGTNGANVGTGGTGGDSSGGATSGTSSSVGHATVAADAGSAGNTGQAGSNSKNAKTAQELFIDNTVKNPTIWSIIGIIVLLALIFGAYYRNDLRDMIKKSKK